MERSPGGGIDLKRLDEFNYLVSPRKTSVYRLIIAFLYDRLERSESGWVWPQDIAQHVQRHHAGGATYDDAECRRDLKQLEEWRVVLSQQDFDGIRTLEELHSAPQLWQITENARRIERLVRELESEEGKRGSLDRGRLRRLWSAVLRVNELIGRAASEFSPDQLAELESEWNACEDTRAQIEEQAIRYLGDLHQRKSQVETDIALFISYRDLLKVYINEFLIELQDFRERAAGLFAEWLADGRDQRLVRALVRGERERKGDLRGASEIEEDITFSVRRLIAFAGEEGTARVLEQKTTARLIHLIERIERFVLERRAGIDRKHQLELLARAFRTASRVDLAHGLAARAFGWGTPLHMSAAGPAEIELNAHESVWLQDAPVILLRPSQRSNLRLGATGAIDDRRLDQARLRLERARERLREKEFWDGLFAEGELRLDGLVLGDEASLSRVTRLVSECMRERQWSFRLLDGSTVRLHLPENTKVLVRVNAPGGVFHTRAFRFTRSGAS